MNPQNIGIEVDIHFPETTNFGLTQAGTDIEKEHGKIEVYTMSPSEMVDDIKDRIKKNPPY